MSQDNFTAKMKQLDDIVSWFEESEIDAGIALEKFKEGTKLIEELKKQLQETENTIKKIDL